MEETFVVYKRYPTNPPTYGLQDLSGKEIAGRFYAEELQNIDKSDNNLWAIEKIILAKGREPRTILTRRGHRLQPEHCIAHYQNQIGNANPYFASDFPIQRGYGFFSRLRRYALPLMMQAGKYLGKCLLTSGRNIVEDVPQGKSFRHAARDQIHQSGREITAHILRKLRGRGGLKGKNQCDRIKRSERN
ncbi:hypothetical protein AVEN_250229-1 [Araneus ventricosus]|uniref:Uncharacterized protein n=1 Tax=Araneus ventricosus TaxID=182803 RepID=A0A4Y2FHQ9_ARAVE|nr:hypothetical protein AVEN_250229-1 [Araneus ventricosus]